MSELKQDKDSWFKYSQPLFFFYDSTERRHFLSEDEESRSLISLSEFNAEEQRRNVPYIK